MRGFVTKLRLHLPWRSGHRLGGGQEAQRLKGVCLGSPTLPGQRTPCDALITSCLFGLFGLFEGRRHAWGLASVSVANRSDIRKCSHFQAWRGGAPAGGPATASAPATWPPHSQAHGASGVAAGPADFCWWVFLSTCLSSVPPDTDVLITYSAPTPVGPHDASLPGLFVSALATWLLPRPPATVRSIRQAQEQVRILTSGCFTLRIKVYRSKFACWRDLHAPYFRTDPEGSV